MWLIDARTKALVDSHSVGSPKYAILSHVWDRQRPEVSFQDMKDLGRAYEMPNFTKILKTCQRAQSDNIYYVWVDTCCINKENNTELSEAINSMWYWYQNAEKCYAYLADVNPTGDPRFISQHYNAIIYPEVRRKRTAPNSEPEIRRSEWFQRGWTLQELIAPKDMVFFDRYWVELGTKQTLMYVLEERTGIPRNVLLDPEALAFQSVAQKMSWASGRLTSRIEDKAYCLLGIFDVNMPLLYGERDKAFLRLQEEIIRNVDDHSIFAWHLPAQILPLEPVEGVADDHIVMKQAGRSLHGLLSPDAESFNGCRHVQRITMRKGATPYSMTNRGLSIRFRATLWPLDTYMVRLNCDDMTLKPSRTSAQSDTGGYCLGILLTRLYEDDQYARVAFDDGASFVKVCKGTWSEIESYSKPIHYISTNVPQHLHRQFDVGIVAFQLRDPELFLLKPPNEDVGPLRTGYVQTTRFTTVGPHARPSTGLLLPLQINSKIKMLKLGIDFDCNLVCFVATRSGSSEHEGWTNRGVGIKEIRDHIADGEDICVRGINERSVFEAHSYAKPWTVVKNRTARALDLHKGLWAMKGDRLSGIDVQLIDRDGHVLGDLTIKPVDSISSSREICQIWQISLDVVEKKGMSSFTKLFR